MVQARTLYLQRVVASSVPDEDEKFDASKVQDLAKRLEELEAHVAESIAQGHADGPSTNIDPKQVVSEVRKGIQPDLEALNRAIRRYEKRTTVSDFQTDTRFQEIETQLRDTTALAADTQRNRSTTSQRQGVFLLFSFPLACLTWIFNSITLALQVVWNIVNIPTRVASRCLFYLSNLVESPGSKKGGNYRSNRNNSSRSSGSPTLRRKNKGKDIPLSRYPRQDIPQQSRAKPLPETKQTMDTTLI